LKTGQKAIEYLKFIFIFLALICFGRSVSPYNKCDVFFADETVLSTDSTAYSHSSGGLGFYTGQPTTVGSDASDGYNKVETLTATGWQVLDDFSQNLRSHSLVGLPNGDMLLIGGFYMLDYSAQNSIWRLGAASGTWTLDVALQKRVSEASAILVDETIYSFGGVDEDFLSSAYEYPIQRIDIDTEFTINKVEYIGDQGKHFSYPILLVVDTNVCV